MIIIPSLVEKTPRELYKIINRLSRYYRRFQIDIEDGVFVPHKTLSTKDFVSYVQIKQKNISPRYIFDIHLMEQEYVLSVWLLNQSEIRTYIGVVFVHSLLEPDIAFLTHTYPDLTFGLVINPDEQVQTISTLYELNAFSHIQLMTVNPGPQGQPFIKDSLNKIEQLRNFGFRGKIYLDGGINDQTIPLIKKNAVLPDVLCPGSFLAKTKELNKHVAYLHKEFHTENCH